MTVSQLHRLETSNGKMIMWRRIGKYVKGRDHDYFKVVNQHFPAVT